MPIAGVVADANVLLSAIIGKAALRVITEFAIQVHVSQFNAVKFPNIYRKWLKRMPCLLS